MLMYLLSLFLLQNLAGGKNRALGRQIKITYYNAVLSDQATITLTQLSIIYQRKKSAFSPLLMTIDQQYQYLSSY